MSTAQVIAVPDVILPGGAVREGDLIGVELRDRRRCVLNDLRVFAAPAREGRGFTPDEARRWDAAWAELYVIEGRISAMEGR